MGDPKRSHLVRGPMPDGRENPCPQCLAPEEKPAEGLLFLLSFSHSMTFACCLGRTVCASGENRYFWPVGRLWTPPSVRGRHAAERRPYSSHSSGAQLSLLTTDGTVPTSDTCPGRQDLGLVSFLPICRLLVR